MEYSILILRIFYLSRLRINIYNVILHCAMHSEKNDITSPGFTMDGTYKYTLRNEGDNAYRQTGSICRRNVANVGLNLSCDGDVPFCPKNG